MIADAGECTTKIHFGRTLNSLNRKNSQVMEIKVVGR